MNFKVHKKKQYSYLQLKGKTFREFEPLAIHTQPPAAAPLDLNVKMSNSINSTSKDVGIKKFFKFN